MRGSEVGVELATMKQTSLLLSYHTSNSQRILKCENSRFYFHVFFILICPYSMDGADLCFEIVNRVHAGFVYSEAVARSVFT